MQQLFDRDIVVRGAREHNLQSVDLTLPRNQLICFTGVSGSGKSSMAFDTLYSEGQRRYLESLSSYARQFVGQLPKPDVDYLSGLSPSIAISQKSTGSNPRSTVGTITEINDFLRVLFARVGTAFCPNCDIPISAQTRDQIVARIATLDPSSTFAILAPLVRGQKGEHRELFEDLRRQGFARARVNGQITTLADPPSLDRQLRHTIEVVVDRLQLDNSSRQRVAEAVDTAIRLGEGTLIAMPLPVDSAKPIAPRNTNPKRKRGDELESALATDSNPSLARRVRDTAADGKFGIDSIRQDSVDIVFSAHYACPKCGVSYSPPSPQLLSFNSPQGMCPQCDGLGVLYTFDPDLLIPDPKKSLRAGAIALLGKWTQMSRWQRQQLQGVADTIEKEQALDKDTLLKTPWQKLADEHQQLWLQGTGSKHITFTWRGGTRPSKFGGTFDGIVPQLLSQWNNFKNPMLRRQYEKYMHTLACVVCDGDRLNSQARHVRLKGTGPFFEDDAPKPSDNRRRTSHHPKQKKTSKSQAWKSLPDVGRLPLDECLAFFKNLELNDLQQQIAGEALKEINARLGFLLDVGLHYLSLSRTAPTLSGGESQRIRLASQIGSGLVGVLYVLDEPSIGLHPRDNERLLGSLKRLRDLGNTLIVVEHDEDTMRAADLVVDFGPGPGIRGGQIVSKGTVAELARNKESLTGGYLSGRLKVETPVARRHGNGKLIKIHGATHNNLKNIDVELPLGCLVCVTGVSGSGKSSLITDILTPVLRNELNRAETEPGSHRKITGIEHLDKIIDIDQSPIGRTPRSNPATYVKLFDEIRDLYAKLPESKQRGFAAGRFSFNTEAGRCSACEGNGANRLDMEFLADLWVTCAVCNGRRYDRETLQVTFKGQSIADCLEMDVQQALELFQNVPKIAEKLQTLHDVGLDYLKLGQPSPTLSGGEAQRIKLSKELVRRDTGRTLYVLDEPTTGLHFADIALLLKVLQSLVDRGNTVVVIEHNMEIIQAADWIIDLGPEGGQAGGEVIALGTPDEVALVQQSATGKVLAEYFARHRSKRRATLKGQKVRASKSKQPLRELIVQGAAQHNLNNVSVNLARGAMTVFCGPSGSGKTSLAMDTIYAEGQRRYVESLSAYARQFVGQMPKPVVEKIEGLSPSIAIEQRNLGHTPRSTVGTVTEIYDYLRVLMARMGTMFCPKCDQRVGTQTADQITDQIMQMPAGLRILLLAPIKLERTRQVADLMADLQTQGYVRVRIDGTTFPIDELPELQRTSQHEIQVVIDRLVVDRKSVRRIADSVETALSLGNGVLQLAFVDQDRPEPQWDRVTHSLHLACHHCNLSFEPLTPHSFSFNTQLGWCPACNGLGMQVGTNPAALLDPARSLEQGGLLLWPKREYQLSGAMLRALCRQTSLPIDVPLVSFTARQRQLLFFGTGDMWFDVHESDLVPASRPSKRSSNRKTATGLRDIESLKATAESTEERQYRNVAESQTLFSIRSKNADDRIAFRFQYRGVYPTLDTAARSSPQLRSRLEKFVAEVECTACAGARVRTEAAHCRIRQHTIADLVTTSLGKLARVIEDWELDERELSIAGELFTEINNRLRFLVDVGLDYLTLGRSANTLSGGEAQRIRLASQLGSGLCGVLYVLDEPTIGLHPRDNQRLIGALHRLRDLGNTLIVVEHDRDVIASSDALCDFGPGSGRNGGHVVACGTPTNVAGQPASVTGPFLSGRKSIPIPALRRMQDESSLPPGGGWLVVRGAREHTLRDIDVSIPLGCLVAVTGPSGSGKSTLINDILYPALGRQLHRLQASIGSHRAIEGIQYVDKVVRVDQSPLGVSPTSNPATYSGVFELIRQLFAQLPDARVRGFTARQFSFNVPGGRCEKCEGNGQIRIEMHFLPDVWVRCDACHGRRYTEETLSVRFQGHSIHDVLEMPIGHVCNLFHNLPKIRRILQTLCDVGLDYVALGQPAPTLSGGEAQRVKLSAELARPETGKTLYLLDEPTTGLHFEDIAKLLNVLHRLVDVGNTVVVIEHNLDVIKSADWVIDLGPEAGWEGGQVVASGTPEYVAEIACKRAPTIAILRSYTGEALAEVLAAGPYLKREIYDPTLELAPRTDDVSIAAIGKQSRAPWEIDGRRWHLETSLDRRGQPIRWERRILAEVIERIENAGCFSEVVWNSRSVVEVNAKVKSQGWFLHSITAETWLLKLKFRVPRGVYTKPQVLDLLQLPTLNELEHVEAYGNQSRVIVKTGKEWQEVELRPHTYAEIDTVEFWTWLDRCMTAFADATYTRSGLAK